MKKIINAFLLAVILIMMSFSLTGCGKTNYLYKDADKYIAGGAELNEDISKNILNVEIDWINGNTEITFHDKNTFLFSEESNRALDEALSLHYFVDDNTLKIKFVKSGSFNLNNLNKNLELFVPESLELSDLNINTVSANISVKGISARNLKAESISGEIGIFDSNIFNDVELESVSGNISLISLSNINILNAESVSGEMNIKAPVAETFKAESVSGKIKLLFDQTPLNGNAKSVSGDINLYLPENADFSIELYTVSGDFNSTFELTINNNVYTCNQGKNKYNLETTSGDIAVYKQNV